MSTTLTAARVALLLDLNDCEGWADFDPPHPSSTVRAAMQKGLVETDGVYLRITPAGRAALQDAEAADGE